MVNFVLGPGSIFNFPLNSEGLIAPKSPELGLCVSYLFLILILKFYSQPHQHLISLQRLTRKQVESTFSHENEKLESKYGATGHAVLYPLESRTCIYEKCSPSLPSFLHLSIPPSDTGFLIS